MPTSSPSKWYHGKTPILQIKILKAIATEGLLSKKVAKDLTGSHYPDVSDAIERLYKDGLILISEFRGNKRDKRFFQLSRKGLESLIDTSEESLSPEEFWKALLWYCILRKKRIDWNAFDLLYRRFQNIYLGYTPHREHFFQFRFIDVLFKKWLKDNDKIYDPTRDNIVKGVIISQRILECLGMNRLVTLGQLCQYIEEQRPVFEGDEKIDHFPWDGFFGLSIDSSEEGIKSALEKFTLPGDYYSHRLELRYDFDWLLNQYADLIQHLVVVPRLEKGETRYELSLFGVVLLLSVRAYYEFVNPEMLFYNNLEFGEFSSKLSTNYKDKLPLIFGNWDSLMKETLGYNSAIFEILRNLFDDHTSKTMIESSVIVGGVKEYYESVQTLSDWSYPRLAKIHKTCENILEELEQSNDCYCHKLLSRKMDEISNSLSQRNLHRFMESLHADSGPNSPVRDPHRIYANELVYIEKALADEINFLFYISFYVRDPDRRHRVEPLYLRYFPDMFKPIYWTRTQRMEKDFDLVQQYVENGVPVYKYKETVHMEKGVPVVEDKLEINTEDGYPTTSFVNIIRKHKEIQQLLVTWIDDALKCQNDVQLKMSRLKNYTRKGD